MQSADASPKHPHRDGANAETQFAEISPNRPGHPGAVAETRFAEISAKRPGGDTIGAWLFGSNAATQFAIQAWLAFGFARYVWGLPWPLAIFIPVALDLFAVGLMRFAYRVRDARLRVRIYAWWWVGCAIAAQVFASEAYAVHTGWTVPGRVASLLPAVFLAVSLHTLIITRRSEESTPPPPSPTPPPPPVAAARGAAMRGPEKTKNKIPTPTREPAGPRLRGLRTGRGTDPEVAQVMRERGVGERRAQQIVKKAREAWESQPVSPAPAGDTPARDQLLAGAGAALSDAPVPKGN
jgi:hypothetical protein